MTDNESPLLALVSQRARGRVPHDFWHDVPKVANPHPKPIQLIGGLPNYQFFPIKGADVQLRDAPFDNTTADTFRSVDVSSDSARIDIKAALQYSEVGGLEPLLEQIRGFVKRVVRPKLQSWEVQCTLGGADGIAKTFDVLVDPGDTVLFEEFTFVPVLGSLVERGGIAVPVRLSAVTEFDYGNELETLLENWTTLKPGLPKPKALYTIPNGHNPLGLAQTIEHKKRVIALAEKHNFAIIEDEPYSYLNFDKYGDPATSYSLSNDEFIASLNPSYTTLDTSGRVVRVETFSKIFAPGMRLGFVVADKALMPFYSSSAAVLTRSPNGYSQMFLNNTILQLGGIEGWIHWITKVRNEYLQRKNVYVGALLSSPAYTKGYLSPIDPSCGMFVSVVINVDKHPRFSGANVHELMELFYVKAVEAGVLVVLGRNMSVDKQLSEPRSNFVRTAISFVDTHDVLREAVNRLSEAAVRLFEDE